MDWLGMLNAALGYLEDNLDGEIDVGRAAALAGCSPYHFSRLFGYVAGVPLAEYVRRRRLTRAAFELADSGAKVLDVALKYGYDSPTAFNRAFRALHGVAPSQARRPGVRLVAYPRLSFQISIKGDVEMEYRIENRPAFTVVGYKHETTTVDNQNTQNIPKMWQNTTREQWQALEAQRNAEPDAVLGVCGSMQGEMFDYYIAVPSTKPAPAGMDSLEIPAATWAIFESVGPVPHAIQAVWKRIYTEWLPTSGYKQADTPTWRCTPAATLAARTTAARCGYRW